MFSANTKSSVCFPNQTCSSILELTTVLDKPIKIRSDTVLDFNGSPIRNITACTPTRIYHTTKEYLFVKYAECTHNSCYLELRESSERNSEIMFKADLFRDGEAFKLTEAYLTRPMNISVIVDIEC